MDSIEVKGAAPMVQDLSIEILFHDKRGTHSLNLWRPDGMGRRGMTMNHPQAFRAYANGLLEMADRFEALVRPEWEKRGGSWIEEPAPPPRDVVEVPREEWEAKQRDSKQLEDSIREFERIKEVTLTKDGIPFLQRTRDALYLDGVLAVLTTNHADTLRTGERNNGGDRPAEPREGGE